MTYSYYADLPYAAPRLENELVALGVNSDYYRRSGYWIGSIDIEFGFLGVLRRAEQYLPLEPRASGTKALSVLYDAQVDRSAIARSSALESLGSDN